MTDTFKDENGDLHPERRKNPEVPRWIRIVILAGAILLLGTFGIATSVVGDVKDLGEKNHDSAIAACESGNISRAGDVKNLRQDIVRLHATAKADRADVAALKRLPVPDPVWIKARQDEVKAIEKNIRQKHKSIRVKLASVAEFAIEPGSPIKDCAKAYPD